MGKRTTIYELWSGNTATRADGFTTYDEARSVAIDLVGDGDLAKSLSIRRKHPEHGWMQTLSFVYRVRTVTGAVRVRTSQLPEWFDAYDRGEIRGEKVDR